MNKKILKLTLALFAGISMNTAMAQTDGTLNFSFTEVAHSPCYVGTRHVIGAWITNSSGAFVTARMRRAGTGNTDHLPSFAAAAGAPSSDCMSVTMPADAVSGGTLMDFIGTRAFTWNGKNSAGVLQADGVYTIHIQTTWNHGSSTSTRTYTFTKGATTDVQSPTANSDFSNVSINWTPVSTVGINATSSSNNEISIYPNPNSTGLFNVTFSQAKTLKVINTLGEVVFAEKIASNAYNISIDLTQLQNGVYFFVLADDQKSTSRKVILNK
jgi:hypothetical protein